MTQNYKIIGNGPVDIVVELGLGSCLAEWLPMARMLSGEGHTILLYERFGINQSPPARNPRTPWNIAEELYQMLSKIPHKGKIILLAHSQGGLYAQQFCRRYPELVEKLILLDPLSARDNDFKEKLSKKEYRSSGVDKSGSFRVMKTLARLHLGEITKKLMKSAPPFYYYHEYSEEETEEMLGAYTKVLHAGTALEEYEQAHKRENVEMLQKKDGFPEIPLILITHSPELAIRENMEFGRNARAFAERIETMWQEQMKQYLKFSPQSVWIQAEKSTHYIHLMEPERILWAVRRDVCSINARMQ